MEGKVGAILIPVAGLGAASRILAWLQLLPGERGPVSHQPIHREGDATALQPAPGMPCTGPGQALTEPRDAGE